MKSERLYPRRVKIPRSYGWGIDNTRLRFVDFVPLEIAIGTISGNAMAKLRNESRKRLCYYATIGRVGKLPVIVVRRNIWENARKIERRALCVHEGLHILLGHLDRRLSSKEAEAEVEAYISPKLRETIRDLWRRFGVVR